MRIICILLATLSAAFAASAQSDISGLERNTTLFEEKWAAIESAYKTKVAARGMAYQKALELQEKAFQDEGDLEGVLGCREEAARLKAGGGTCGTGGRQGHPGPGFQRGGEDPGVRRLHRHGASGGNGSHGAPHL
jgi:hypothetical protein